MSSNHWERLDAIAERISELAGQVSTAEWARDLERAAYFRQQARQAELERQQVVDALFGTFTQ